jgi:hypothetical protein
MPQPDPEQKLFVDALMALCRQGFPVTRLHRELTDRVAEFDDLRSSQIRMLRRQIERLRAGFCARCGQANGACQCAAERRAMGASG